MPRPRVLLLPGGGLPAELAYMALRRHFDPPRRAVSERLAASLGALWTKSEEARR